MTRPNVQHEPSEFVAALVKEYYDDRRANDDDRFFSSSQGDGYRTLDHSDLQDLASKAEAKFVAYEQHFTQRISQFIGALDDLAGQAQDEEETSTPEEAIGWAQAQFMEIFGIKEIPQQAG